MAEKPDCVLQSGFCVDVPVVSDKRIKMKDNYPNITTKVISSNEGDIYYWGEIETIQNSGQVYN